MPFPLLPKWGKEVAMIGATIRAEWRAKKRKALLDGPAGQLTPIKEELLCFVFEKREQGINGRMTGLTTHCATVRRRRRRRRRRAGTMRTARTWAMVAEGRGDDNLDLALVPPPAAPNSNVVEHLTTLSSNDGIVDVHLSDLTTTAATATATTTAEFVSTGGEGTSLSLSTSSPTNAVADLPNYLD
jgi:hypothetical protein